MLVHGPGTRPSARRHANLLAPLLCAAILVACKQADDGPPAMAWQDPSAQPTGSASDATTADPASTTAAPTGQSPDGAGEDGPDMGGSAAPDGTAASDDAGDGGGSDDGGDDGTPDSTPDETPAAGAAAPEPEPAPDEPVDYGEGDGSDVVTIGDSWMSYALSGGGIEGGLRRAGKDYRGYAVAGTTLSGSIPGQFDRALRDDPNIATVIMTGGGNDIMFSGGCNTAEACEESVLAIVAALDELWTHMADNGVQDILYIRYAEGAGTTPDSTRPTEPPPPPSICLTGRVRCHSMDTTEEVDGSLLDGIHPTSAANDRIAASVIALMEEKGMRR